jgi:hypothetical protein
MAIMKRLLAFIFLLLAALSSAQARTYSQPELDRMLAPVALYPDSLLSQMLMAATYPDEIALAARWSRANPGLEGEDAVRAAEWEDWDPSVKSLLAFPQVLQRMDENREWTRQLGEAFLEQQPHVMDTVQQLRQRAHAAGNLRSNEQLVVQQQGPVIYVQPARPEVVYVPYYDPFVVYGPWWHAAYPPVFWRPWPGYTRVYYPGVTFSFWFGRPAYVAPRFFYGGFDWHRRHAQVVHQNYYYHRQATGRWQHDAARRPAAIVGAAPVQIQAQPAQVRVQPQVQASRVEVQRAPVRSAPSQAEQMQRQEYRRREAQQRQSTAVAAPAVAAPSVAPMPQAVPRSTPAPQVQPRVQRPDREERRERQAERREQRQEFRQAPQQHQQQHQRQAHPHNNQGNRDHQRDNRRG